jgi:hypothetical protein
MELVRVKSVTPLRDFVVHIEFTNGTERDIDLSKYLRGPVFEAIKSDPEIFVSVKVDPVGKTVCWDNGADIDPDTLYHDLTPAWAETVEMKIAS